MRFKYRYSLEKHRNGKRKYICPRCGNKEFVKYIDNLTNRYVADHVGKCDRQSKCLYHLHPYEYLKGISANKSDYVIPKNYNVRKNKSIISQIEIVDSIPFDYANQIREQRNNNLNNYLYRIFGEDRVNKTNWDYYVGSAKNRMTIFPLIDKDGILRSAKFMLYNPDTGKRLRDVSYSFDWLHCILSKKGLLNENFKLKTCLFGEHQIGLYKNRGKTVYLVESEKTAIIASLCISDCLFMATGSLENLTIDRLKPLRGHKIKLYPDTSENGSAFKKWKKKADEARLLGFDISVSDFLEKNCTKEQKTKGWDLADYLIDKILVSKEQPRQIAIEDPILLDMIGRNPAFEYLINTFHLEVVKIQPIN